MVGKKPKGRRPHCETIDDHIRSELSALWQNTDGDKAFVAALEEHGYLGDEAGVADGQHAAAPSPSRYEAFRLYKRKQRIFRLGIRPVGKAWERVSYSHLHRIGEDQEKGKTLTLMFTNLLVVIVRGRNLKPIADAIDLGLCEFIQQFDPSRWPRPDDENAPFIESMEFYYPRDRDSTSTPK